ncbi:MAG: plasmid stabilization protein [Thiotrichaceae bacterium IS1]|nr:MAG: plasmid stabilization protein [Thiotrichaceae bacterium IS1]
MYQIEYEKTAIRTLARIPQNTAKLIRDKIKQLAQNPFARNHNVTRLVGQDQTYRLRVGDWRVIYQIDQGVLKILVLKIGPRGGIYT